MTKNYEIMVLTIETAWKQRGALPVILIISPVWQISHLFSSRAVRCKKVEQASRQASITPEITKPEVNTRYS